MITDNEKYLQLHCPCGNFHQDRKILAEVAASEVAGT
jgi:hypothetical protein